MEDPYLQLRQTFAQAGFYMPTTEKMGSWQRLIVCSKGPPDDSGFNGRSFWVAEVSGAWFVGTWGPFFYRIRDPGALVSLTRDFFADRSPMSDFSAEVKHRYGLTPLDEAETDQILPDERPEN